MPKFEKFRKILIAFLVLILFFSLTGCSKSKEDENKDKKEKVNSEISYLDTKIITILNSLNNISFSNYKVVAENVKEEKDNSKNKSNKESSSVQDENSSSSDNQSSKDSR